MAGRGPAPAENRRRRNADTYADAQHVVVDDGTVLGPEPDESWSSLVIDWYETWRRSPQAKTFVGTDWQRLRMLAPTVEAYVAGDLKAMTEIRLNESLLGATHADRLRNRVKVEREAAATLAPVTALYDRDRLAGGGA